MFIYPNSRKRPAHFGPFPLESLPRDNAVIEAEAARTPRAAERRAARNDLLTVAVDRYSEVYSQFIEGDVAPETAPLPDDLERRSVDAKGICYFMDASQVGICEMPDNAWLDGAMTEDHGYAIVILVEHGRIPEKENLANAWVVPAVEATSDMRAAEIAALAAGHIRQMGFSARIHFAGHETVDRGMLAVLAGLGLRDGDDIINPYLNDRFALAIVTTEYELAIDQPLSRNAANVSSLRYWWSHNGAPSGRERNRKAKRRSDLGPYAMETVRRVDRPTTLIIDSLIP